MRLLKVFFSLFPHYLQLSEKLWRSPSRSIFRECLMKQKTMITITIITAMVGMTTMVTAMVTKPVLWMHMASDMAMVMDGEFVPFPKVRC